MQRDVRLDVLRVIAIVAVIWLHVSANVVASEAGPHDTDWWIGNIADAFSRWCVPLFVMASGALLLAQRPDIAPLDFYRRRASRILLPTFAWTLVYLALRAAGNDEPASSLLIAVVRGAPYYHLWFLYMIAGLYIAAPLLSRFLAASPPSFALGAVVLIFAVTSVESTVASLLDQKHAYTFLGLWPAYLGYFLAGFYLWQRPPAVLSTRFAAVLALGCGAAIAVLSGVLFQRFGVRALEIAYANLQPLVIAMSLAMFTIFARARLALSPAAMRVIKAAVPLVFGIYVIHPLWLLALDEIGIDGFFGGPVIGIPLTTAIAFALSLISAQVLAATPFLRRII